MSSRCNAVRPVIVEVKPSNKPKSKSNLAPSSPGSPKAVRFAEASLVKQDARKLNTVEAWSLYHFETHARTCRQCLNPLEVHRRGARLCQLGQGLAQDVAEHVYHQQDHVYSTIKDNQKHVRVELGHDNDQVRQLLRSMEGVRRSAQRTVPIISYDSTYAEQAGPVIIEPATSHRRSKHRSSRYPVVSVEDDDDRRPTSTKPLISERRKSLYAKDMQRDAYHVEIREPADEARRRRRHDQRKSEGYFL